MKRAFNFGASLPQETMPTFLFAVDFHYKFSHTGYNNPPETRRTVSYLLDTSQSLVTSSAQSYGCFYSDVDFLYPEGNNNDKSTVMWHKIVMSLTVLAPKFSFLTNLNL